MQLRLMIEDWQTVMVRMCASHAGQAHSHDAGHAAFVQAILHI